MDWLGLIWNSCVGCSVLLPLCALAAIALRVACHWSGLEIPALGRAMAIVLGTAAPTVLVGWLLQVLFVGVDGRGFQPVLQFIVFAVTLFFNVAICTAVYSQFLRARPAQALGVWLASTLLFLLAGLCLACVIGIPVQLIRQEL